MHCDLHIRVTSNVGLTTKVGAQNKGNWLGMKPRHDKAQAHSQDEWEVCGRWSTLEELRSAFSF